MNFEDYSYDGNEYAFTIVDEKQPIVSVSFGGVDSGASCNVIDRQLWESLKRVTRNSCIPMAARNH